MSQLSYFFCSHCNRIVHTIFLKEKLGELSYYFCNERCKQNYLGGRNYVKDKELYQKGDGC
jgi:hypothetical protein